MPGGDGTGPVGRGRANKVFGRGGGMMGRGAGFTGPDDECRCPNCGYHEPHQRGVPCNIKRCPKCNTKMIRN